MTNDAFTGSGARYTYHAPSDDHAQALVRVRFYYATVRRGTSTRPMAMFNETEAYGLREEEAAFIVSRGLGAVIEG